ncbi:MAG TPA: FMN-binding negative transcriptional regulator [Allosphingosinicella sp.]|jgi:transcriptional regulator
MHPARPFRWDDPEEMLEFIRSVSFCTIFAWGHGAPGVVHAPVVRFGDALRFHVSRSNRALAALEGGRAILSCLGPDAYISPDWYGSADQVPTWNYLSVEAEGPLRRLDAEELAAQVDALSAEHEARLAPKAPWTKDKMSAGYYEKLLTGIVGFELRIEDLRGTRKFGQHKSASEMQGAAAGVRAAGSAPMADLMLPPAPSPMETMP